MFGNDQRSMGGVPGVVEVGKIVGEGQHHDFVEVPGLTFVADGIQAGTACGNQSLFFAGDRQIAMMSQSAYSL
ncbi:hypothetical protein D3C79_1038840 [compost metagenome]